MCILIILKTFLIKTNTTLINHRYCHKDHHQDGYDMKSAKIGEGKKAHTLVMLQPRLRHRML